MSESVVDEVAKQEEVEKVKIECFDKNEGERKKCCCCRKNKWNGAINKTRSFLPLHRVLYYQVGRKKL